MVGASLIALIVIVSVNAVPVSKLSFGLMVNVADVVSFSPVWNEIRDVSSRKVVISAPNPVNVILRLPLVSESAIVVAPTVVLPSVANSNPLFTLRVTISRSSLPSAMRTSLRSNLVLTSSSITKGPTLAVASLTVGTLLVLTVCTPPLE